MPTRQVNKGQISNRQINIEDRLATNRLSENRQVTDGFIEDRLGVKRIIKGHFNSISGRLKS